MPMETKSAPWGSSGANAPSTTMEVSLGSKVLRFHRSEDGKLWFRVFEWRDEPPGYLGAGVPELVSPKFRAELLRALNEPDTKDWKP